MCDISFKCIPTFVLSGLVLLTSHACFSNVDSSHSALSYKQWYGELGRSGLRRSLANTSDLGELANRAATYRLSKQSYRLYSAIEAVAPTGEAFEFESDIDAWVAQVGSMVKVPTMFGRNTAIEGMLRSASREGELIDVVSNHIDAGLVWNVKPFANKAGYFALHGIYEQSQVDTFFVNGERETENVGGRIQLGEVFGDNWAYQLKAEKIWSTGDSFSYRGSASGPVRIEQDIDSSRTYINADLIARYTLPNFIIPDASVRWRSGVHYLTNHYEDQRDNLGLAVVEPFGPTERLGIVRTGGLFNWRYGDKGQWSPLLEMMYDYEFQNNMDEYLKDPHTVTLKIGLAWLPALGQRVQFEVQRFQGLKGKRARSNLSLTVLLDQF